MGSSYSTARFKWLSQAEYLECLACVFKLYVQRDTRDPSLPISLGAGPPVTGNSGCT